MHNLPSKKILFIFIMALFSIVGLFAGVNALFHRLDPFDKRPFDSVAWIQAQSPEERAPMARDLIRKYLRPGLPVEDVKSLLGSPERVPGVGGSVDGFGNRLRGEQTYSYYLGCWSGLGGLDSAFLYIHLDGKGCVLVAEVTGG